LFCCCKLREWVWTETGKGDRLGGDNGLSPSPPSERPAPPHSLHRTSRTIPDHPGRRPASHAGLVVLQFLVRICHASFACLCHNPMPATLFALPLCHHHHVRQDHPVFCKDCPAGSLITGLHLSSPCIHFVFLHPSPAIHSSEPETALSSLATSSSCIKATSNGLWDGAWPAMLG